MDKSVLSVDIGTSSLKAALVTADGTVLSGARCRFPRTARVAGDWTAALREALAILKPEATLAAVVVSGNGPTLVSVDAAGTPGRLLMWNDPIGSIAGAGSGDSIFIPRICAFRTLYPEHYERSRWILSGPEYLVYALTGTAVTILPDRRYEPAYWTAAGLASSGLDAAKLPPFVLAGTVAGTTSRSLFPDLRDGIPVVSGGPDFTVALIGTGTLAAGKACDRAGTSEGLNVCTASRASHPEIRTLPAVTEGLWNASYLLPETGALFHAYRRASGQTTRSYPDIMADIKASPIFPQAGAPLHPGRAVVEGIGFSVRKAIRVLHEATGLSPEFCLSGGQARNGIWNQMKADITGSTFALTATPDGELMGDAILGFTALGDYASMEEAAGNMVHIVQRYEPDPRFGTSYSEKYAQHENL